MFGVQMASLVPVASAWLWGLAAVSCFPYVVASIKVAVLTDEQIICCWIQIFQ
jgi:hypothetical protein